MGRFVEGQDRRQSWLLPSSLDDYVTADNPVRDRGLHDELDLGALGFTCFEPAATGRPAYDPATLLKSASTPAIPTACRRAGDLECEAQRNIEVMWPTGRLAPDHKTIANQARQRACDPGGLPAVRGAVPIRSSSSGRPSPWTDRRSRRPTTGPQLHRGQGRQAPGTGGCQHRPLPRGA